MRSSNEACERPTHFDPPIAHPDTGTSPSQSIHGLFLTIRIGCAISMYDRNGNPDWGSPVGLQPGAGDDPRHSRGSPIGLVQARPVPDQRKQIRRTGSRTRRLGANSIRGKLPSGCRCPMLTEQSRSAGIASPARSVRRRSVMVDRAARRVLVNPQMIRRSTFCRGAGANIPIFRANSPCPVCRD
jgi:hypothetical protein